MAERTVTIRAVLLDQLSTPLSRARSGLIGIRDELEKVGRGISPLTGRLTQLVAGFLSFRTAQESLTAARQDVEAQQRLLAALQGRVRAQEEIVRTAGEIQAVTRLGDEVLVEQAATMRAIGLQAELIPRALRIAADVAEQLGQPLEAVARDITIIGSGGEARTLPRFIGELRQLREEGASTEEVLAFLEQRFRGAAETIAGTTFGRITQEQNRLGDALEGVGKVLAELWLPVLQAGRVQVERLAEALQSPSFGLFARAIRENAAAMVEWASRISTVVVGFLAAKGAIAAFMLVLGILQSAIAFLTIPFLALSTVLGTISAAVGAVIAAFSAAPILFGAVASAALALAFSMGAIASSAKSLGDSVAGSVSEFDRLFGVSRGVRDTFSAITGFAARFLADGKAIAAEILAGKLSIADLWDFVRTRLGEFSTLLRVHVVLPASEALGLLRDLFGDLWDFAVAKAEVAGIQATRRFSQAFGPMLEGLAKLLDAVFGTRLEPVVEVNRAAIEGTIASGLIDPLHFAEREAAAIFDRIGRAPERFQRRLVDRQADIQKALAGTAKAEGDLQARLRESRERNAQGLLADLDTQTAAERERITGIVQVLEAAKDDLARGKIDLSDLFGGLDEGRIRELFEAVSAEGREEIGQAISGELERGFREGELSARRFFELRRSLALEAVAAEERSAESVLEERRKALQVAIDEARTAGEAKEFLEESLRIAEAQQAPGTARLETAQQILAAAKDEADALLAVADNSRAVADAEERRNQIAVARLRTEQELADARVSIADQLVQQADEARQELEAERDRIRGLFEQGLISGGEVNERDAELLEVLRSKLQDLAQELRELAPSGEQASEGLEKAREAMQRLSDQADSSIPRVVTGLEEVQSQQDALIQKSEETGGTFSDMTKGVGLGAKEMVLQFSNLGRAGVEVGRSVTTNLARGIVDVFVTGKKRFKEFLGEFLLGIAEMIAQLIIYRAVATALGFTGLLATPGAGGGGGGVSTPNRGGLIRGFDRGGSVPGPRVHRDIVPAILTPGEFVLNESAVAYYGDRFMTALNRRLIPREILQAMHVQIPSATPAEVKRMFNTGGPVSASASGAFSGVSSSQPSPAFIVANEEAMRRLLAAGSGSMRQWLSEQGYQPGGVGRRG